MTNTSGMFRECTSTPEEVELQQLRRQCNNQKSIIENLQKQNKNQRNTIAQLLEECKELQLKLSSSEVKP